MSAPAVVAASYVKLSTLVDGTCRIVLDVEPRHMALALQICSKPGAPVALAALTDDAAVRADHETAANLAAQGEDAEWEVTHPLPSAPSSPASDKPRRERTLAEKVVLLCGQASFQKWLKFFMGDAWADAQLEFIADTRHGSAADCAQAAVKWQCNVFRKRDIIEGNDSGNRWHELEETYLFHARTEGLAA